MENKVFNISEGNISFLEDKIIISDKAVKTNRLQFLSAVLWIIYGIISVFRYIKTGDQFLLWTGIFIGLGHVVILMMLIPRSTIKEIDRADVTSVKLKNRYGNKFLDIKLKNGKLRRVSKIGGNSGELKEYIHAEF